MIEGFQALHLICRQLRLLPLNQVMKIITLKVKHFFSNVHVLLGLITSLLITVEGLSTSETLEKRKRKYSQKLYQWTQEMWNNTKRDIE